MKKGSCHCQAVMFEAQLDLKEALSCNCSICQRKGTLLAFVPETQFKLISGKDQLTDYQFGKKSIHHTFCKVCGVTAFATGKTPDGKTMMAINVRCMDDFNMDKIELTNFDGRSL